jgi:hypothetical protein
MHVQQASSHATDLARCWTAPKWRQIRSCHLLTQVYVRPVAWGAGYFQNQPKEKQNTKKRERRDGWLYEMMGR